MQQEGACSGGAQRRCAFCSRSAPAAAAVWAAWCYGAAIWCCCSLKTLALPPRRLPLAPLRGARVRGCSCAAAAAAAAARRLLARPAVVHLLSLVLRDQGPLALRTQRQGRRLRCNALLLRPGAAVDAALLRVSSSAGEGCVWLLLLCVG